MKIFFSYSSRDRDAADEIYYGLRKHNLSVTRDELDVKFTESWIEFMKTIRDHDFAIALISENYLQSTACLYEMLQFQQVADFEKRIIPIMLDRHLYAPQDALIHHLNLWDRKIAELEHRKTLTPAAATTELDMAMDAKNYISHLVPFLKSIKMIDLNVAVEKTYIEIQKKIHHQVELKQQFDVYEKTLYDTLLTNVIDGLNEERRNVIKAVDDPKDLALLAERRFKFRIRESVREKFGEFAGSRHASDSEILKKITALEALPEDKLFEVFLDTREPLDATLSGHVLGETWRKAERMDKSKVLPLLEQTDFPYYKLAVVAEWMELAQDASLAEPIEKWLRRHLYLVKGREQTEVWALFCDLLKRLDNKRYQQLFALAHYDFLKKRDHDTAPYKYPLLPTISGFKPDAETYVNLLDGTEDEKLAAIWVLSFFGGIYIFLCNRNFSPLALPQKSKDILVGLSQTSMDYKDKWRLCCAAASIHLLELIPWLKIQTQAQDMRNNKVSINHPTYDLIEEPEAAMAIRACGYFALLARENGDTDQYEDLKTFLDDLNANRRLDEDPYIVVAIATALGYLGNPSLLLRLIQKHREPWVIEAAINATFNLTDKKGKEDGRTWIRNDIGEDRRAIENNTSLTPLARKTYIHILEELDSRLGFI